MKNSTIYLYAMIFLGLIIISLLLSFNSGFKQGVLKAKECLDNKGFIELKFNSFKCNTNHNLTLIDNFNNFNFSGVKIQ